MRFCGIFQLILVSHNFVIKAFSNERAPQINTTYQKSEIAYLPGLAVTLPCPADGVPAPTISWRKNGVPLDTTDPNYERNPESGDLTIREPRYGDDSDYNCLASNRYGVAVGIKMKVKRAVINPFPSMIEPRVVTPAIGESLTIPCTPPTSYPKGISFFGFNRPGSNKLENIINDNRVLLDYDGNLHFANVLLNDSLSHIGVNVDYLCVVRNAFLGAYVQGNDHKVRPRVIPGSTNYRLPSLLWSSASSSVAVLGQTKLLKCIFGGLPTPNVTWNALHAQQRFEYTPEGYGTEIRFNNIVWEDAGVYMCTASNSPHGAPVSHRITLNVESPPFWREKPVDLEVPEGSDIEVKCQVQGVPKPNVTMFVNGNSVHEHDFHGRKTLKDNKLRYQNVTNSDSQVIQCLAENEHGVLLTNIILKVNGIWSSTQNDGERTTQSTRIEIGNATNKSGCSLLVSLLALIAASCLRGYDVRL